MDYSEKTLEYYEKMKNIGGFDDELPSVGTGIVGSPLCGDVMKLQLFFDKYDVIADAKYKVFGCVSAIASMELVTTMLKGMSITEALKINNADVADSLELTKIKRHCSVLAKEAIEAAISDYLAKKSGTANNLITVSEKAAEKLRELISTHGSIGISISLSSSGCSGIDYSLSYETEKDGGKLSTEISGITFFFDKENVLLIRGVEIDLVENSFGDGFSVINSNHVSCQNCNCGGCSK